MSLTLDDISDSCGHAALDEIAGKQVSHVQSTLTGSNGLAAFTIRFTDGYLLKVDATGADAAIETRLVDEAIYLRKAGK